MATTKAVTKTFSSLRTINTYKRVQRLSNLISGALAGQTDSRLVAALIKIQALEAASAKDFVSLSNETEALRSTQLAVREPLANLRILNAAAASVGAALKMRAVDEIVRFDQRDELAKAQSLEDLFSKTSLKSLAKEIEKVRRLASVSTDTKVRNLSRIDRFEKQLGMKVFELESVLLSTKRVMLELGVMIPKVRAGVKVKKVVSSATDASSHN